MKKLLFPILAVFLAVSVFTACKSAPPENPFANPELTVSIPELFSPDPDQADYKMPITIAVKHPVPIKDWQIQVQPARRANQAGAGTGGQRQPAAEGGQRPQGDGAQAQTGERRRRVFLEQTGTGTPPKTWSFDGKGTSGEMVQSATDYQFILAVNDIFDNSNTYEGIISVDVLVRREGDLLRIIVPSIVFPPNSANFALLTPEEMRPNVRVLGLIARALNKFEDYQITVEGHANPTTKPGTAERTTEEAGTRTVIGLRPLSEDRAKAVIEYLATNNNIARARLSATGLGGTRTVADWDDDEENWKNRRVEFILKK
jgi:outer membrane protein OmpA-like peptidoglycan-associated protein